MRNYLFIIVQEWADGMGALRAIDFNVTLVDNCIFLLFMVKDFWRRYKYT